MVLSTLCSLRAIGFCVVFRQEFLPGSSVRMFRVIAALLRWAPWNLSEELDWVLPSVARTIRQVTIEVFECWFA